MDPISFDDGVQLALRALVFDRLALLAGAGLSMAPPSQLPSALVLAQRAKKTYEAIFGPPSLSDDIEEQAEFFYRRHELASVYLARLIDRNAFAGRPNSGHYAVADLLLSHAVQTAVTTNIDTLIETAGQDLFGHVEAGIDRGTVAALPPHQSPLLKIHGCRGIDLSTTVWAPSQLKDEPVKTRVEQAADWLKNRLLNRDLLIVGFWTDWDYLNDVLSKTLGAVAPARVIVVDPQDSSVLAGKAPALHALGLSARSEFRHVQASGADFLAGLRLAFSQSYIRRVLASGRDEFEDRKGVPPDPDWLDPPLLSNDELWSVRRDLQGCGPQEPASERDPSNEPLLGLTLILLRAAGATADGSYWQLRGEKIRVLRTPNRVLHKVEGEYRREIAPIVAPDVVVAVGSEDRGIPATIVRPSGSGSIARGGGSRWMTRAQAEADLRL